MQAIAGLGSSLFWDGVSVGGGSQPNTTERAIEVGPVVVVHVLNATDVPKADTFSESDPKIRIWVEDEHGMS
jgi:hypothetical protein